MITATRHTGLVVRDLDRSLRFYRDILGLTIWKLTTEEGPFIERLVGIPAVRLEWAKLKAPDGSLVELLQYHSHPESKPIENAPANRLGCSHIAFTVANLGQVYNALCEEGLHCNNPPQDSPNGSVRALYCHDPDGILVELVEELSEQ